MHHGANGATDTLTLHGGPIRCSAIVDVGPYIQTPTFGYRILVSSTPGPFLFLAQCTGFRMSPVAHTQPDSTYRIAPLNGSGDTLRVGQGRALARNVTSATIHPNETLYVTISTKRCDNAIVGLIITHFGLELARWA